MVEPYDNFNRGTAGDPLGTSTSGHTWTLRPTGPYNNVGATIPQVTSDIYLNGLGQAIGEPVQQSTHLQFATIDHGTGDSPAEGWEVGWQGSPGTGTGIGLVFRWQDATHYWNAFWYHTAGVGADNYVFVERQNGSTFAAASPRTNVVANNNGVENVLRVIAIGNDIDVYFNEVQTHSISNSSFATAPHHGISFFHYSGMDWFGRPTANPWTVGRVAWGDRGPWH